MNDVQRQNHQAALAWRAEMDAARGAERAGSFEAEKKGIAALITREAAAAWESCGAFEWVALGYLATSSALIAVFAENLAHPVKLFGVRSEEHTSELQSRLHLVCRLLLEKKKNTQQSTYLHAANNCN